MPASKTFTRLLDSAPSTVQRQIVEQALIPILDNVPKKDARTTVAKARQIAKKFESVPQRDLAAKKGEVNGLLDELAKDAKTFSRQGGQTYEILLQEVVESVAEWLNDLWKITYEFSIDFPRAHSCLLFSMGVLDHLQGMKGGGCRCMFQTVYVPIMIKNSAGEVMKKFSELGVSNVESAILWVWREVFLALLASKSQMFVKLMPDLLSEIDDIIGWRGLERLVLGGSTFAQCAQRRLDHLSCEHCRDTESDFDSEDESEDDIFYADHWNSKLTRKVPTLRRLVQARMTAIFKVAPSVQLFSTLTSLATDHELHAELYHILSNIATTSGTSLATAIEIYSLDNKPDSIAELLDSSAFLLRPRDSNALQEAVRTLAASPRHRARALTITEKELLDAAGAVHHGLRASFSRLDTPEQRAELLGIVRLRRESATRQERVERWVEGAVTPGLGPANPMAFAAMMMGLPVPVLLDIDEADQLGFLDLDPHDPDFAELREEYRPDIKSRFDGWTDTAAALKGGAAVLEKAYKQMFDMMPWLLAQDIVDEMIGRIADKPSKHHVCDALASLSTFANAQRKKRRRKTAPQAQQSPAPTPNPLGEGAASENAGLEALISVLYTAADEGETENESEENLNEIGIESAHPGPAVPILGGIEGLD